MIGLISHKSCGMRRMCRLKPWFRLLLGYKALGHSVQDVKLAWLRCCRVNATNCCVKFTRSEIINWILVQRYWVTWQITRALVILQIVHALTSLLQRTEFCESNATITECKIEIKLLALRSRVVINLGLIRVKTRIALIHNMADVLPLNSIVKISAFLRFIQIITVALY